MYVKVDGGRVMEEEGSKIIQYHITYPITVFVSDFTPETTAKFYEDFTKALDAEQSVIPIVINSYGGEVYSLLAMIDMIKSTKVPVATIALGNAHSCGFDLLAAGTPGYRFAGPSTSLMLHSHQDTVEGSMSRLRANMVENERLNEYLGKLLAKNCGQDEDYFLKMIEKKGDVDIYMNVKEGKKHNIIDHIKIPTLTTTTSTVLELK